MAKRRYAPKSRGGCVTCKSRHVRCDQQRPRCGSCQKSSRQCSYSSTDRVDLCLDKLKVVLWEPTETKLSLKRISPVPDQSPAEARALDYFRDVVATRLAGTYDQTFWTRVVLQASHKVSPLRHAMVALSSHWENVIEPGSKIRSTAEWDCDTYALQQYTLAITEMRRNLQQEVKPSTEELLLSNLLFFCIEMFQNHYESALRQLSSGVYLFCEWNNDRFPKQKTQQLNDFSEFEAYASHIFRRLMVQSMLFPIRHLADNRVFVPEFTPVVPDMPENFESADEARDYYNFCMTSIVHSAKTARAKLSQEPPSEGHYLNQCEPFQTAVRAFKQWQQAFRNFMATNARKLEGEAARYCTVMEMHDFGLQIVISSLVFTSEDQYDSLTPIFESIIDRAAYLINSKSQPPNRKTLHYPKFDIGLIPPMCLVAIRCRHPILRRKAVELLRRGPRQEGVWNSDMIASVAERTIELEEKGLHTPKTSEDVPLSSRVKMVEGTMYMNTSQVVAIFERQIETDQYQDKLVYEIIPF